MTERQEMGSQRTAKEGKTQNEAEGGRQREVPETKGEDTNVLCRRASSIVASGAIWGVGKRGEASSQCIYVQRRKAKEAGGTSSGDFLVGSPAAKGFPESAQAGAVCASRAQAGQ